MAAAGNEAASADHLAPSYIDLIKVGGLDVENAVAEWSNHGSSITFYAPGEEVWCAGIMSDDSSNTGYGTR